MVVVFSEIVPKDDFLVKMMGMFILGLALIRVGLLP